MGHIIFKLKTDESLYLVFNKFSSSIYTYLLSTSQNPNSLNILLIPSLLAIVVREVIPFSLASLITLSNRSNTILESTILLNTKYLTKPILQNFSKDKRPDYGKLE